MDYNVSEHLMCLENKINEIKIYFLGEQLKNHIIKAYEMVH